MWKSKAAYLYNLNPKSFHWKVDYDHSFGFYVTLLEEIAMRIVSEFIIKNTVKNLIQSFPWKFSFKNLVMGNHWLIFQIPVFAPFG